MGEYHIGRAWSGHEIEDSCPCGTAACGLVNDPSEACPHHAFSACKTMRQGHSAEQCPAKGE